jgi:dTDP-3-amino-2,3,6-trideoxy-4-keto-D-glucose/dTDP-3-amino-3,4,6-trideoxy-alpha-D-glucose/dTDP-2,6-dideoxy-D-kanosamine transaminase
MIRVPFNDLRRGVFDSREIFSEIAKRVIDSGWFIHGPELQNFERLFAEYLGPEVECVGVANGTDALELALRALGVGDGDNVVTAPNAGGYAVTAILAAGATPRFVDVEDLYLGIDPERLASAIDINTRALIFTHLYGNVGSIEDVVRVAGHYQVPVIEDCAQAHGAKLGEQKIGTFGDASTFSFYPTKNLGALGDAGCVATKQRSLASKARQLRAYGWSDRYVKTVAGGRNSRMDELQAAFLCHQLSRLETSNATRRTILGTYKASAPGLKFVDTFPESVPVAHLCVLRTQNRDRFRAFMEQRGIATDIHFPLLDTQQPAFDPGSVVPSLPVAERAVTEIVSLPCFPGMTDDEITAVSEALSAWSSVE